MRFVDPDIVTEEQYAKAGLTRLEYIRTAEATRFVHARKCPRPREEAPCMACPTARGVLNVLRHLDAHPRDAKGARRILHDTQCMSCRDDDGRVPANAPGADDHAARTQAPAVAALRKFRESEREA